MQLGLSKRKHLPALFLNNSSVAFPLWAYSYIKRFEKSKLSLSPYAQNVLSELRGNLYKPPFSLKGKTVLDLGACCGESAWYFLEVLGADKVFCVESDAFNIKLLRYNREVSKLNFEVIPEKFKIEHLQLPFDFLKCDIEGSESLLADCFEREPCGWPCVVEAHSEELRNRFEMLGFSVAKRFAGSNYVCFVMNNFLFMEVGN